MYKPITFQQKKLCCIPTVHITFILCFILFTSCDERKKLGGLDNSFVEHCSANTETVGSNPFKALSFFFSGA